MVSVLSPGLQTVMNLHSHRQQDVARRELMEDHLEQLLDPKDFASQLVVHGS